MITLSMLSFLGATALAAPDPEVKLHQRVEKVLKRTPLIDGHNDVPWQFRSRTQRHLQELGFDTSEPLDPPMHTSLPGLRAGQAGAVFWSVWIPTSLEGPEALLAVIEQIDVVHRMTVQWPQHLELARTAQEIRRIHDDGRVASLIGMEGGHSIGRSLPALRMLYEAGARYMTLTHWKTNAWADAATDAPTFGGLSPFGEEVVHEMNRLGMMVDLSHVSAETMRDTLAITESPVIFSHSGALAINPHPRNVPDDVLDRLKENGGLVMVDFLPSYVSAEVSAYWATRDGVEATLKAQHLGDPEGLEAALGAWDASHPVPKATLAQVADHIDHIRDRIGAEHVGIGSDFDGMGEGPEGLEGVSEVPELLVELLRRGYTDQEISGIAGENLLRVMAQNEAVAARLRNQRLPSEVQLEEEPTP